MASRLSQFDKIKNLELADKEQAPAEKDELDFLRDAEKVSIPERLAQMGEDWKGMVVEFRSKIEMRDFELKKSEGLVFGPKNHPEDSIIGEIDKEFLGDMDMFKNWPMYHSWDKRLKPELSKLRLNYVQIIEDQRKCLLWYHDCAKLLWARMDEIDKALTDFENNKFPELQKRAEEEVDAKYLDRIPRSRQMKLIELYKQVPNLREYMQWVHPSTSPLPPPERLFVKVVNKILVRFEGEDPTLPDKKEGEGPLV